MNSQCVGGTAGFVFARVAPLLSHLRSAKPGCWQIAPPRHHGRGLPTTAVVPAAATPSPTPIPIPSAAADDANPAAVRAFLSRLLDSGRRALSGARPWSELADRAALSRPESLADATSRLRKNLAYFRVN